MLKPSADVWTTKIVKSGNALAVILPPEIVSRFNLKRGDNVDVSLDGESNAIVIRTQSVTS